jgi:hypothetical protein
MMSTTCRVSGGGGSQRNGGDVLSPTPFPALDVGKTPPSVNAELVTVMAMGA